MMRKILIGEIDESDNFLDKEEINNVFKKENIDNLSFEGGDILVKTSYMGFIDTFYLACKNKKAIALYPHDFFNLFLQNLSLHINLNPEKYRELFTISEPLGLGKTTLLASALDEYSFDDFIQKISDQLKKLIKFDISIDLTTTTFHSNVFYNTCLMDMGKEFYEYVMLNSASNPNFSEDRIPCFNVYGEVEDWQKVIDKITYLGKLFHLEDYSEYFVRTLKIIKDCDYEKDKLKWDNFFYYDTNEKVFSGNINFFFLYDSRKRMLNNTVVYECESIRIGLWMKKENYIEQIVRVPFEQQFITKRIKKEIISGFCGVNYDYNKHEYRVCNAYGIKK
jgi:hypothetical protein